MYLTYHLPFLLRYRQTRKFMQRWIKPGVKLIDMCELLEDTARTLVEANGLKAGEPQGGGVVYV